MHAVSPCGPSRARLSWRWPRRSAGTTLTLILTLTPTPTLTPNPNPDPNRTPNPSPTPNQVWRHEVLPAWAEERSTKRTLELWWEGVPSALRGQLWRLAIGDRLQLGPTAFATHVAAATAAEAGAARRGCAAQLLSSCAELNIFTAEASPMQALLPSYHPYACTILPLPLPLPPPLTHAGLATPAARRRPRLRAEGRPRPHASRASARSHAATVHGAA